MEDGRKRVEERFGLSRWEPKFLKGEERMEEEREREIKLGLVGYLYLFVWAKK